MHLKWFLTHSHRAAGWLKLLYICSFVLLFYSSYSHVWEFFEQSGRHFVRSKRDEAHLHMLLDKSVPPYTFTKKHLSPCFTLLFIWIITIMFAVKLPWNCSNVFHHSRFAPYAPLMPPLKGIFPHLFASHYLRKKNSTSLREGCLQLWGGTLWENNHAADITILNCSKNSPPLPPSVALWHYNSRCCHPLGLMHVLYKMSGKTSIRYSASWPTTTRATLKA